MKIAQVMPYDVWGGIGPEMFEQGIGGREGAMIRLSKEWAELGCEVTNFIPSEEGKRYEVGEGFHEYVPVSLVRGMLSNFEYDAVVAWECPSVFADEKVMAKQPVRLVEMQCAHFAGDAEQEAASVASTGVVALSEWHRDFMVHDGLEMDEDRLHVLPNCVDLEKYPEMDPADKLEQTRKGIKLFYSSSPDRGLWHLLKLWPQILAANEDSQLVIGYGAMNWVNQLVGSHYRVGQMAMEIATLINQPGVVDAGKIGQSELARVQRESSALLYPCDTMQATETGCITVIEAMAAYCPVVTTDCDCLGEEFADYASIVPLPFEESKFASAVSQAFVPEVYVSMAHKGRKLAESRQWKDVAPRWLKMFEEERRRDG